MSYLQELGSLALWSRIRSLTDKLLPGVERIYREQYPGFKPRWFAVTHYLAYIGPSRLTDVSKALDISHPSVVQIINQMEKNGLAERSSDNDDKRVTQVRLSDKGKKMVENLEPVWQDLSRAVDSFLRDKAPGLIDEIEKLEKGLNEADLYYLIKRQYVARNKPNLKLVPYTGKYYEHFRKMNLSWLEEYVGVSDYDMDLISDPEKNILAKGGKIFMGVAGKEVIGTATLMPLGKGHAELSKFTVERNYRRLGLGKALLDNSLVQASNEGFSVILLLTHNNLKDAVKLYQQKGFKTIKGHELLQDRSGRCSVTMKLIIK